LKAAMEEIQRAQGEIILFIDELHTVVGAGSAQGAMDASNMLKPAWRAVSCNASGLRHWMSIANTSNETAPWNAALHLYLSMNPRSRIRLKCCVVYATAMKRTTALFSEEALVAAAKLSSRYVTDRHLPDKAIDLMDEAAAKLRVALHTLPPELKKLKKKWTSPNAG
jgi:ATP-dependent Clp protease ATP-binding subunit ClpC